MMIMAQHPQKQTHHSADRAIGSRKPDNHADNQSKLSWQSRDKAAVPSANTPLISNGDGNPSKVDNPSNPPLNFYHETHQRSQGQDGKRALIKNQLYLIEQLQLENANLRNERDQLQLENEELKFQLQMIRYSSLYEKFQEKIERKNKSEGPRASSNILARSSTTFNDERQLHPLIEHQSATNGHDSGVVDNSSGRPCAGFKASTCAPTQTGNSQSVGHDRSNDHFSHQTITSYSRLAKLTSTPQRQPMMMSKKSSESPRLGRTNSEFDAAVFTKTQSTCGSAQSGLPSGRLSSAKVTSLSAFNMRADHVPTTETDHLLTVDRDEQDDELRRSKLVQQLYGDSEKVQAAAITIQRAFRKYQICKRFRTITNQLRQATKSSPIHLKRQQRSIAEAQSQSAPKEVGSVETPVPFASGATRAAAWESLSQAASRLAASAASAKASTKQVFTNGVSKSASSQHVASANCIQHARQSKANFSSATVGGNNKNFKPNSVVAAAINFQQLESIRKRQYRVGLNVFNKSPERGVSFLIAHSFIDSSPPFTKTSHSYYLSNQLHFIDKQQITAHQQAITLSLNGFPDNKIDQNCKLCHEEENLKRNVAHFLLNRKGLAKEKIGQYLGNLQSQFNQDVLIYYLQELDFHGLQVDVALRKFSSTMRMPGEAQKIERLVDWFAQRYVQCQQWQPIVGEFISGNQPIQLSENQGVVRDGNDWNAPSQTTDTSTQAAKNNLTLLTKDEIFILTFAIIMLNTDLHSPSLKSTSRMSASQFINNLRGVFKSRTINEADLVEIYERVKSNQITTTPDHVTHVMKVQQGLTTNNFQKKELPNLCVPHRRLVCFCRLFEVYDINKKERVGQHQREIFLFNDTLLVTKLSRRPRANTPPQYTYRQSIPLQGLYVQLFQSPHYNFGIRLCRRSNDQTLIMFNARNELDQSRFVDDLNESIAEMDEMETIRARNLIESIHAKQLERLRRHAMLHESTASVDRSFGRGSCDMSGILENMDRQLNKSPGNLGNQNLVRKTRDEQETTIGPSDDANVAVASHAAPRLSAKFSSMSNLASVAEVRGEDEPDVMHGKHINGLRQNRSFVQAESKFPATRGHQAGNQLMGGQQRSSSSYSVHSLDSGLFLSRDVSPNQSG